MLSLDYLLDIELNSSFNVYSPCFSLFGFCVNQSPFDPRNGVLESAKSWITIGIYVFSSFYQVFKIKVDDVVASNDIRIYLLQEIPPSEQHSFLSFETVNTTVFNLRTFF